MSQPPDSSHSPSVPCQKLGKNLILLIIALYLLDQLTKWWIVLTMDTPSIKGIDQIPVIDGVFNIVRVHNTGVAFGLGNGQAWASYVFLAVPVIALIILLKLVRKGFFSTSLLRLSAALLISGVLGNLTDRLTQGFALPGAASLGFWENLSRGYVVDFIDIILPFTVPFTNSNHWPSFNVADSCVTVAAILLFIGSFTAPAAPKQNTEHSQPG